MPRDLAHEAALETESPERRQQRERCDLAIEWVKRQAEHEIFDMRTVFSVAGPRGGELGRAQARYSPETQTWCGTVACIGGTISANIAGPEEEGVLYVENCNLLSAGRWLGLGEVQMAELFVPWTFREGDSGLMDLSVDAAIRTLEHLRDTGDVVWQG